MQHCSCCAVQVCRTLPTPTHLSRPSKQHHTPSSDTLVTLFALLPIQTVVNVARCHAVRPGYTRQAAVLPQCTAAGLPPVIQCKRSLLAHVHKLCLTPGAAPVNTPSAYKRIQHSKPATPRAASTWFDCSHTGPVTKALPGAKLCPVDPGH